MERYKVYFRIKGDDSLNVYHTSATCEQEAIWQWQASCFAKKYECEFLEVKHASPEKNHYLCHIYSKEKAESLERTKAIAYKIKLL